VAAKNQDLELLAVCHYVVAVLTALMGFIGLAIAALGVVIATHLEQLSGDRSQAPPALFGSMFVSMGVITIVSDWGLAVCLVIAGRFLRRHRHHLYCMIIAAIACLFFPFGTVLGIFTIIALQRPDVKELFRDAETSRA
jgi:hypothetical protein